MLKTQLSLKQFVESKRYIGIDRLTIFREMDITKRRIEKILKAGANVILTTGGIDDLCLKQFVEAGAMAVRRCRNVDLKRIAKASGGLDGWRIKRICHF